ncbi:glycoside hydrolase family 9 protein [Halalkalibacterium halodurans]|uniref:glycoside hydrolase family 9 protein n=1 Tax=Halalkalibacterium halodurans TaxID=86665 RepID=UPI002E1AE306|nr:glycoside hydrolase family 9 protein [Halalkalibacterium halodurans]MED4172232.1 glycoside hydrolase family 9 protein [Halalkalibacterium halodurans]
MKGIRLRLLAIAAVVFTFVISPNIVQASYGAPEGWRDLPDYYIFKDTHRGGWSDGSGGLETENNNLPVDWDETYEGLPSLRFNVTEPVDSVTSINVLAGWASHDKSNYVPNGHLEFYVKGKEGGEQFMIGGDDLVARRDPVERQVLVPVSDYVTVTTEWQHVKIPLKDIYDNPDVPLDAKNARAIRLDVMNNEPVTVWINQLKMTSPDKEPGFPEIKVNQVGFRNFVEKYAYVSGFEDEFTADVGTPFQVRRVSDNTVAYSGELVLRKDYDIDSGERVLKAVFTDLEESGHYYITVDAEGIEPSLTFKIGNDVYQSLLVDASRYYLYQRSGMDLEEPFVPDYPRADITPMDTAAPFQSDPSRTKDVSKGWFDAGDKGKYVTAGSSAVIGMLWSYELFPDVYSDQQFNLPESGNGVPDILDENRWELEWLLNMQDEESGGFYAKVESMNNNNDTRAIRDIRDGIGNLRPTNDTAYAAAALAYASLVYEEFDPDFAAQSLEAAKAGWVYLEQNPDNIKGPEHAYATDSDKETRLLAAATLYRVTGESKYHDYFLNNYEQSENVFVNPTGDWVGVYNYAFFQYMKSENIDEDALNWYKDHFTIWLDKIIDRHQTNAWNHTLYNGNFYWGSLNQILGMANEAMIGSKLLGMYDETIHNMSLAALHYILGANPLRKSFVTGHGEDSLQTVYGIMNDDPRPGIPSGFMPLGPNRYTNPGMSIFPAKNFLDSATEWTTNEHAVGSTASLVFISAFANSDLTAPTNPLSLEEMVTQFLNDGLIRNKGIANSLQKKLSSNQLGAFVNQVKAQRGKHISAEAADQLIEKAEYLLSQTTGE